MAKMMFIRDPVERVFTDSLGWQPCSHLTCNINENIKVSGKEKIWQWFESEQRMESATKQFLQSRPSLAVPLHTHIWSSQEFWDTLSILQMWKLKL